MAEDLQLGSDGKGRIREFWTGFGLAAITLGLYELWWYYFLNDELRTVGRLTDDVDLSRSRPAISTAAVGLAVLAGFQISDAPGVLLLAVVLVIASLVSQYRFGQRLRRAQELVGIAEDKRFNPWSFLLLFPGNFLVIPPFFWYARVTHHQNEVVRAAAKLPVASGAAFAGLPG